jgi:hypothetical protein
MLREKRADLFMLCFFFFGLPPQELPSCFLVFPLLSFVFHWKDQEEEEEDGARTPRV